MFAIIQTGGKQYKVSVGDEIYVEKIEQEDGSEYTVNEVLAIDSEFGTPFLKGAKVVCTVEKQGLQPKIDIIKHRSQKHHTKRQGHRQPYTKLVVKTISN
ncbi:MAG: 50S ribosomal protein L21 [Mycoplasmataceae bacterium]|jgi:large subunit ribosomal protein L21|nr:50S ribosomal protein L21 [Mycoplasmataceae bacterium]